MHTRAPNLLMFCMDFDLRLPVRLQYYQNMCPLKALTCYGCPFSGHGVLQSVPSTAASSCYRRGASHQHVEMLTRAALRTASPAPSHSSQQASRHPVSDAAVAKQYDSKRTDLKRWQGMLATTCSIAYGCRQASLIEGTRLPRASGWKKRRTLAAPDNFHIKHSSNWQRSTACFD